MKKIFTFCIIILLLISSRLFSQQKIYIESQDCDNLKNAINQKKYYFTNISFEKYMDDVVSPSLIQTIVDVTRRNNVKSSDIKEFNSVIK